MKFSGVILICVCAFAACNRPIKGRNGVVYKSAVQYNDYIVTRQTTLMQNVLDLIKAADHNIDSAENMLNRFVGQTASMIEEIKGMPAYKGDSALRDAAVRSFIFYKKVFGKDYMQIIQIRKKGIEVTNEDIAEANRIVEKITEEEGDYDKRFHEAQKNFAAKNNMKLRDNEMQKKFEKEIGQ